ncbi:MAG TPA: type VI secretion system tip protein TssI/VgrG [Longimicrobiaceae bacterium]|nr:type VI secretion system tip protein TssI/VgrG [Longimicrobiaceae bacterium]
MPATLTQAGRPLRIDTPLGTDALLLTDVEGSEGLSRLFEFRMDVVGPSATPVAFEKILGEPVTATVETVAGEPRFISGIVSRIAQGGRVTGLDGKPLTTYRLDVVPELWLLTRRSRSRIFQQKSVPDILRAVLDGLKVSFEIQGTYEPRNFCTQYGETDFDFASRLMEEEGIYYFFKHEDGRSHTLVLADTPASHPSLALAGGARFEDASTRTGSADRVRTWEKQQEIRSGKRTLWDHNFGLPNKNLEAAKSTLASVQVGSVTHKLKVAKNDSLELYDYPGGYAKRFDGTAPGGGDQASDLQKIFQDNSRTVGIRMQEEELAAIRISGTSGYPQFTGGGKFELKDHPDGNGAYVLVSVDHHAHLDQSVRSGSGAELRYENGFTCIPDALAFRPARTTPRPRIGCQTADVVGPQGEEIFTDKYGRVKVQFHWDREGKDDASSSCWVRVASSWAGKNWGAISIPRVGQEVVVDFLEGDPDRPLIVGSVYNADMLPPYALPDNKTQSGIKSRSSAKGTAENFNEIRFEDKKDNEEIYVHAEKNLNAVVENDETRKVGFEKKDKGDQTLEVFNNQTVKVGAGAGDASDGSQLVEVYKNQSVTVKTGDQTVEVSKGKQTITVEGDRAITVKTGNDTLTVNTGDHTTHVKTGKHVTTVDTGDKTSEVKMGNQTETVSMGNVSVAVKMGNHTTKLDLGKISQEAMQGIELKVGQSSIKVDQMGVTIQGMMVKIEGQVQTQVKGLMTQINGDAMLQAKGGITMIN